MLGPLFDRQVRRRGRTDILSQGADYSIICVLLVDVSDPPCYSITSKDCRHEISRNAQLVKDDCSVELDVGSEMQLLPDIFLKSKSDIKPLALSTSLRQIIGHAFQDHRPRIKRVVDAMPEAHYPVAR